MTRDEAGAALSERGLGLVAAAARAAGIEAGVAAGG